MKQIDLRIYGQRNLNYFGPMCKSTDCAQIEYSEDVLHSSRCLVLCAVAVTLVTVFGGRWQVFPLLCCVRNALTVKEGRDKEHNTDVNDIVCHLYSFIP